MTIYELCSRCNITRRAYRHWRHRYPHLFPPPHGATKNARYGIEHVEAINAFLALKHFVVSPAQVTAYCAEAGISLTQYVQQRERAIRDFGLGVG